MSDFVKNPTEVILYSGNGFRVRFYKNNSSKFSNGVGSSGTIGTHITITSERIVYSTANFIKMFDSNWAESLGMYGFEIKKEYITKAFLRRDFLPVSQEYVFETKSIVIGIEVGYFWEDKIRNAIEQFLKKT